MLIVTLLIKRPFETTLTHHPHAPIHSVSHLVNHQVNLPCNHLKNHPVILHHNPHKNQQIDHPIDLRVCLLPVHRLSPGKWRPGIQYYIFIIFYCCYYPHFILPTPHFVMPIRTTLPILHPNFALPYLCISTSIATIQSPLTYPYPLLHPTTPSYYSMEPTSLPTFGETLPSNETEIEIISVAQVTPLCLSLSYIPPH